MFKKICATIMLIASILVFLAVPVLAVEPGEERVTIGADLTEEEIAQIYDDFDLVRGEVKEIIVTNAEEREYLSGLVPDKKIGSVALSCIYITTLEEGSGISVTTNNINWCTDDIYINALITAGVENASVMVSAPFAVSGTAALTGIYKAYEDITGIELDQSAKEAAAEELVITSELADTIGSDDATLLINELKKILDQTKDMTDEELRSEILNIAAANNIELSKENIIQIINLCRTLETLDVAEWGDKLTQLAKAMDTFQKAGEGASTFFASVGEFFANVGDFFVNIFSKIGQFFSGN
jgi:uncharacterized protein YpuA (DUF1002 family)